MGHHAKLLEKADAVKISSPGLKSYTKRIREGELVKFARYGDGEWSAILSPDPAKANCDGHPYSFELSSDLSKSILEPSSEIEYGMQPLALTQNGDMIAAYVEDRNIKWTNADVFHAASEEGRLAPFVKALRKRRPILVGPQYFGKATFLNPRALITVPLKNAYSAKDAVIEMVEQAAREGEIFLFAASMLTEVIIYECRALPISMIDVGSLFDPYLDIYNRGYMQELKLEEAILGLGNGGK